MDFFDYGDNGPPLPTPSTDANVAPPPSLEGGDSSSASDWMRRNQQNTLLGLYGDNGNARLGGGGSAANGGQAIDPMTGKPYDFTGMGGNHGWDLQGGFGTTNPDTLAKTSGFGTNVAPSYSPEFLKSIGYGGAFPSQIAQGVDSSGLAAGPQKEFQDYLNQQGYKLGMGYTGEGSDMFRLQAFNKDNKPVGIESQWANQSDPEFQLALQVAGAALGGMGGGAMAAGGGSAIGTGLQGTLAGAVGTGAGAGFGATAARTGDIGQSLKGAAIGGATAGLSNGIDPAGMVGVSDPTWARPINSMVGSGARAALTGQPIGSSMLSSAATSALGAGLSAGAGALSKMGNDYGMDTSQTQPDQQPDWRSSAGMNYSRPADPNFSTPSWSPSYNPTAGNANWSSPDVMGAGMATGFDNTGGGNPIKNMVRGNRSNPDPYSPSANGGPMDNSASYADPYASMLGRGSGGGGIGGGGFDNMAGNLMQLYQSWKNQRQYGGLASNLSSLYSPNSPYAQQLNQTLMRSDAAAGRRSQVGPRNVELQARLAELNSRNAPEIAKLYASGQNNQGQMLSSLMRMGIGGANGGGGFDWLRQQGGSLSDYFRNQMNPTPPSNTSWNNEDYAPGDGPGG